MKITESQIRSLIKVTRKSKKTLYGYCPKCKKNEFGISLDENHIFGCFRKKKCGWTGNIFTLYAFLGIPFRKDANFKTEKLKINKIERKLESFELEILPEIKMPIGFKRVFQDEYLDKRGFTREDYENYVCGKTILSPKFKDRIIVGFKDQGRIVAYSGRTLTDEIPKYRNSKNEYSSKHVDGLSESDYEEATLVEGLFDRISVRNSFEILGIESRVLSCHGAKINEDQIKLMRRAGITKLNLFFDPDVLKVIVKSGSALEHQFDLKIMSLEDRSLDPGDCDVYQIAESYLNRKNFINFTKSKLPIIQL